MPRCTGLAVTQKIDICPQVSPLGRPRKLGTLARETSALGGGGRSLNTGVQGFNQLVKIEHHEVALVAGQGVAHLFLE